MKQFTDSAHTKAMEILHFMESVYTLAALLCLNVVVSITGIYLYVRKKHQRVIDVTESRISVASDMGFVETWDNSKHDEGVGVCFIKRDRAMNPPLSTIATSDPETSILFRFNSEEEVVAYFSACLKSMGYRVPTQTVENKLERNG